MSKSTTCGRCGKECLDYRVRSGVRECIACVGAELDELLRAIGRAVHDYDSKPGKVTALRYVEQLATEGTRRGLLDAAEHCDALSISSRLFHPTDIRKLAERLREIANTMGGSK